MTKIEFFIARRPNGYVLLDGDDRAHLDETFPSREAAADMAIRFAQDAGALYAIHY